MWSEGTANKASCEALPKRGVAENSGNAGLPAEKRDGGGQCLLRRRRAAVRKGPHVVRAVDEMKLDGGARLLQLGSQRFGLGCGDEPVGCPVDQEEGRGPGPDVTEGACGRCLLRLLRNYGSDELFLPGAGSLARATASGRACSPMRFRSVGGYQAATARDAAVAAKRAPPGSPGGRRRSHPRRRSGPGPRRIRRRGPAASGPRPGHRAAGPGSVASALSR